MLRTTNMIEKEIQKFINEYNNKSDDFFSGLSPFELHQMIYYPFEEKCPIVIRESIDDAILNQIPFFRLCETFLKLLERDVFVKLTPLGALPKKVIVELYNYKYITVPIIESGFSKLTREHDSIAIQNTRYVCELSGLIKKRDGKLSLTKKGKRFINNRNAFFKLVFTTFSTRFNWSFNDGFVDQPIAQHGNLYTLFLLLQYGKHPRLTRFYADKYVFVFKDFIKFFNDFEYKTAEKQLLRCYEIRSFERFTNWFGLTITCEKKYDESNIIQATILIDKILEYIPQKG